METDLNLKNFENNRAVGGEDGDVTAFSFRLTRQHSIYSLTFDEFQNTVGGSLGKEFGSMNMDEFLKNIWSAEENQNIGSITGGGGEEEGGASYLQKQGSLTIPRTLSLKTVDEVWQDMLKEYGDSSVGVVGCSGSQREPTLGEITLEDFLAKAGVVRDEAHVAGRHNDPSNNWDFGFKKQQETGNGDLDTMNAGIAKRPANLPLNINFGCGQLLHSPKMVACNGHLSSPTGARTGILGMTSPKTNNTAGIQTQGGGLEIHGLGNNGVGLSTGSPVVSSDNGGVSSISPTPYMFSGLRGRKMAAVEKVLERRQRRMIKNRESAARSRARKQVSSLKQKSLACLRRTNTGPW